MGNAASVKLKEGTKTLEITKKLVRDFQHHINLVDHSVTGFARSFDSLRASLATVQKIEQRGTDKESTLEEDKFDGEDVVGNPQDASLLETIDELVSDNKFVLMESLSNLFRFIIETGISCNVFTPETMFSVDKYLNHCSLENFGNGVQYCDARLESMQRKVKTINAAYQMAKNEVEIFYRREGLYHEEKSELKKTIGNLENNVSKFKEEIDALTSEKNANEIEIERLRRDMSSLQRNAEEMKDELTTNTKSMRRAEENQQVNLRKIEEMQRQIDSLNEEKTNLTAEIQNLNQMHFSFQEEKTAKIKSLTDEIEKKNMESDDLRRNFDNDVEMLKNIKNAVNEEIPQRLEAIEMMQQKCVQEQKSSKKNLDVLMCEVRTMDTDVTATQKQIKEQRQETNTHFTNMTKLIQGLEEIQATLKEINADRETLRKSKISQQSELSIKECLSTSLNSLNEEIKKVNTDLKQLSIEQEKSTREEFKMQLEFFKEDLQQFYSKENVDDERLSHMERLAMNVREKQMEKEEIHQGVCAAAVIEYVENVEQRKKCQAVSFENKQKNIGELKEKYVKIDQDGKSTAVSQSEGEKIKLLKEKIQLYEEDTENIKQSLEHEKTAKENCLRQLTALEEKQRENDLTICQIKEEKNNLEATVKETKTQLKTLQIQLEIASRVIIHVQVYYIKGFRAKDEEAELMTLLQARMAAAECIDLRFLNCTQNFSPLSTELPLLIVCSRSFKVTRDKFISICLKGFKETRKTALLIFQDRDEKSLQKEVSHTPETGNFGGIFDIGHKSGIYQSEINSRNIDRIINFITAEGVRKSRKTTVV